MSIDVATASWSLDVQAIGLLIAGITSFFIAAQTLGVLVQAWYIRGGLRQMERASDQRDLLLENQARELKQQALDSERRHRETMQSLADERSQREQRRLDNEKRHQEFMRDNEKRHQEFMRDIEKRHQESMRSLEALREQQTLDREQQISDSEKRHQESMRSLEALIERTAPPSPGGVAG